VAESPEKSQRNKTQRSKTQRNKTQWDFVVVSHRLPVDKRVDPKGKKTWTTSPGGLVAALAPVMNGRKAAWVGWTGVADEKVRPFTSGSTHYAPVTLSEREVIDHYEGFSNATIWPLYHDVIAPPEFRREWWEEHKKVNEKFAKAVDALAAKGATVWVHDYQLQLLPKLLRDRRPDLTIGYFHHIPFPGYGLFAQLPWRVEILEGLLGADVVGFQRKTDAANMTQAVRRNFTYSMSQPIIRVAEGHPVRKSGNSTPQTRGKTREVRVDAYPISLDFAAINEMASRPEIAERAATIREELGNPKHLFLGVDRLDYTKGIGHRLKAFGELFEEKKLSASDSVFVQLASPSRERVESYQTLRADIELQVGRINGEHGHLDRPAVVYLHQNMAREEMMALYLAADVMVVTPLRDGMNLVAKEFIAARQDDSGVLVLSEFTGAADELTDALLVNPHDIDGLKAALLTAAKMRPDAKKKAMSALRRKVKQSDVNRWATGFLADLSGQKK
jgi:trehalose 6-phosphate synthase